jgi:hypothetical protein
VDAPKIFQHGVMGGCSSPPAARTSWPPEPGDPTDRRPKRAPERSDAGDGVGDGADSVAAADSSTDCGFNRAAPPKLIPSSAG